ncbi:MAG: hypothetical protein QM572_18605 [Nocardioides sp.]|uniref:hypothetical protein n=1 Tax=Nocardioides sp. TaxID=35761 RepID=UPI0039E5EEAF
MTNGTHRLLACGIALTAGLALTSCSLGDAAKKVTGQGSASPSAAPVTTQTSIAAVTGRLDQAGRDELSAAIGEVIDDYLDAAYLGDFPRTDFSAAFADFTDGAREQAQDDLDLLTSTALSGSIDEADATQRTVALDILAPKNTPAGVTATWDLTFDTTGTVDSTQHVTGRFDLTPIDGAWKVFGYTVKAGPAAATASTTSPTPTPTPTPTMEVSP